MTHVSRSAEKFSPRGLVLDMDGLMVDSEPLWFEVERAFAASRGGDWTAAHAHAAIGRGMAHTLQAMSEAFGFATDEARDTRLIQDAFLARAADLKLKPGLLELLAAAEGAVPIAVASSSPMRLIRGVLERFALTARVNAVVSGESVPSPKPAPDIFLQAAREIGVSPSQCAVMEDSLAGATAGRAAGMFVIAVPEGFVSMGPQAAPSPGPPSAGLHAGFEAVADRIVPDLFAALAALELSAS